MTPRLAALFACLVLLIAAPALAHGEGSTARYTVDRTPIEALTANPQTKAILDKEVPHLEHNTAYARFKTMTLTQLAPMSQGAITPEKLKEIQARLDQIK